MSVVQKPTEVPAPPARRSVFRALAAAWDRLFGPPRVRELPDGTVTVRLLGRRFDAATRDALFDLVAHERSRLLEQVVKMHESAVLRSPLAGMRFADTYHRDTQRVEDRVGVYTSFLARLARELGLNRAD